MLMESMILAMIIVLLSGSLRDVVEKTSIKMLWMPILAFFLESLAKFIVLKTGEAAINLPAILHKLVNQPFWIELIVYGLLLSFVAINFKQFGFKLLWLGMAMNGLVILINGGMMPVDTAGIRVLGFELSAQYLESGAVFAHNAISETTQLSFLADIWHIAPPYPFPKSISPGDFIMDLGILTFAIRTAMAYRKNKLNEMSEIETE